MDLDPIAEEEERRLEDHNEAADARGFMGFGETHGDPIELDGVPVSDPGTGTGSTSTASPAPTGSAAVAPSRRRKRSKCWNDFDELTKVVNGKTVRFPIDIRTKLTKVFNMYESKFGDERQRAAHQPATAHGSGKKKMAWDDIYDDDDDIGGFPSTPLGRRPSSSTSSPHALSTVASTSELASYLDSDILTEFDEEFNILFWWQKHKLTYPILSLLAKDVMTVPASTISSESTFSLAGRVIEERRRRLTPDMVEVLSCIKDWELADTHLQHTVEEETEELEEVHENMYLDVDDAAEDEG
ncbi:hypothetical protein U9M48_027246 [Paspalum notatum var. saurae]|uniref:HAT C-terminal dimerisation domain-containing protein n=1 Tax=Paspalum notatum var. saurae TaxID=547442 RepID=A0AAQ3TSK0_PASNO